MMGSSSIDHWGGFLSCLLLRLVMGAVEVEELSPLEVCPPMIISIYLSIGT